MSVAARLAKQATIRRASQHAQRQVLELDEEMVDLLVTLYETTTGDVLEALTQFAGDDDDRVDVGELHTLLEQIDKYLEGMAASRGKLLDDALTKAAQLGGAPFEQALGSQLVGRMNFQAVHFVREFQAADGMRLSDRIWRLDNQARETVHAAVQNAVIRGSGAARATQDLLARGAALPASDALAIEASTSKAIGAKVEDALLKGRGSAVSNALRVFRTEINRAHGTAYQLSAEQHPDSAGTRFMLSPRHPRADICDMHARANLYGLGPGVYPPGKNPWPAHPNTLSFVIVVFRDEVTEADAAGKQSVEQFLESVPREQRQGILGKNKNEAFEAGDLATGMVKARWKDVRARLDRRPDGRDPLTRRLFNQRVSYPDGVPPLRIGTRVLTRTEIARLTGAPDGASIRYAPYDKQPALLITHPLYSHHSRRSVFRDPDGGLVLSNDQLFLDQKKAPKGTGLRIFATQARAAAELGFQRISIFAGRSSRPPAMNGYSTWPQYGANAPLPDDILAKLPAELAGSRDLLDLMKSDGGRAFWREHGYSIECSFDLEENSRSWDQLNIQLTRKGVNLPKRTGST